MPWRHAGYLRGLECWMIELMRQKQIPQESAARVADSCVSPDPPAFWCSTWPQSAEVLRGLVTGLVENGEDLSHHPLRRFGEG